MATSTGPHKFLIDDEEQFFKDFPRLKQSTFVVTSPATPHENVPLIHNCFAYTVGQRKWLWPELYGQWPEDCRFGETIKSFVCAYAKYRFKPCQDGEYEPGVDKIAVYAKGDNIKHVAIQLSSRPGVWRSKCGLNVDIEHTLDGLEGSLYGKALHFFRRAKSGKRSPKKPRN